MSSIFPSVLTTYTNPLSSNKLNAPSHSGIETNQNSGLGQVEAVIGVEGASSVVGSLQYLIKSPASDGGGHIQAANKGGTGQITYTKGDTLVATGASVLSKLSVGADGAVIVADSTQAAGIKWASPTLAPTIRFYNTASVLTWNKPSVLSYIIVEMVGGGGGSGGINAGGSPGAASGGGGSGAYSKKVFISSVLQLTATITVGSAGTGGSSGDNDGIVGGNSSFFVTTSSSILATGGGFGAKGSSSSGGAGGIASGGDVNIPGDTGYPGRAATTGTSGGGGGKGGKSLLNTYGSGGAGVEGISTTNAGNAGAIGAVIIYEY